MAAGIQGLLLAAGAARRFGSDKRVALFRGATLAAQSARNLRLAGLSVLVVVRDGADGEALGLSKKVGVRVVVCPEAGRGMGVSLSWGVGASLDAAGWLVALADMPRIAPETIRALAHGLRTGASMIAPSFQGRRGHPVGFSDAWRSQLLALTGDQGARDLLRAYPEALTLLDLDDPGVLLDIDTQADLATAG